MGVSLHAAFVPSCRQLLAAMAELTGRADVFCAERGITPADMLAVRFAEDMFPLAYQIKSMVVHSAGAIEGVRSGTFSPDRRPLAEDFPTLTAMLNEAVATLDGVDADEMESFIGRDMSFVAGDFRLEFVAEEFLLSFTQPNFYFHATTAYDLLRWKGMAIGKRDFVGRVRLKMPA